MGLTNKVSGEGMLYVFGILISVSLLLLSGGLHGILDSVPIKVAVWILVTLTAVFLLLFLADFTGRLVRIRSIKLKVLVMLVWIMALYSLGALMYFTLASGLTDTIYKVLAVVAAVIFVVLPFTVFTRASRVFKRLPLSRAVAQGGSGG